MAKKKKLWKPWEHDWHSFEESKEIHKKREEPKLLVHNATNVDNSKIRQSLVYFIKSSLSHIKSKSKLTIEVWINRVSKSKKKAVGADFACKVMVKRPNGQTIFIKKIGMNTTNAIRKTLFTLKRKLADEGKKMEKSSVLKWSY